MGKLNKPEVYGSCLALAKMAGSVWPMIASYLPTGHRGKLKEKGLENLFVI